MDKLTARQRSSLMSRVRSRDTKPELIVRRMLHAMGFRYRLHRKDLPGKPDLVFPSRKKVIFVNGCFWHGHTCARGKPPTSNTEFWLEKISGNKARDRRCIRELKALGWQALVVWQCSLNDALRTRFLLQRFLGRVSSRKRAKKRKRSTDSAEKLAQKPIRMYRTERPARVV